MRLCTFQSQGEARVGIVAGDSIIDLQTIARSERMPHSPATMLDLITKIPLLELRAMARKAEQWAQSKRAAVPLARARLLAPIPRPTKNIMCMGRNYAEHARESGNAPPEVPVFFTKPPTAVIGPQAPVVRHAVTEQLDYEVELAVVIGRRGRNIAPEKALDYVFGYTIMNDVTARDLQRKHMQWFKGKSLDTFAPMGPWIVLRTAVPNPQALRLTMRVNGEVRQNSTTANMIFTVAQLVAVLSAGMTLEPGDILATGTPEGVGMGMKPPKWLQVGDEMEAEIEGIGALRNRVIAPR